MSVADILTRNGLSMSCRLLETVKSSVTTSWGVEWDEMQIARDLLQNFYDANRTHINSVGIRDNDRDVLISAPGAFDVRRLFYLGSEKTSDDVGQYGEGFKAAATCLLRDHGIAPLCMSGSTLAHVRLSATPVEGTMLLPLLYDFYKIEPAIDGALLILPVCPPKLKKEIHHGMSHFFFDENPLLGAKTWQSYDSNCGLYEATTPDGHVFYKQLKRATIPGIPVVIALHKAQNPIENRIRKDRDRNAFEDAVLELCYRAFAKSAADEDVAVRSILQASKRLWQTGHPLLKELAEKRDFKRRLATQALFNNEYYSVSYSSDESARLQHAQVEAIWKQEHRRQLPGYFTHFGVPNAAIHLGDIHARALAEDQKKSRELTNAELKCKTVLDSVLRDLSSLIANHFSGKGVTYRVGDTEAIMGALKRGRGYRSMEVFLAATLFTDDFARTLAVYLHEHSHIFGFDGSRGFTDALTEMIETIVRSRKLLEDYDKRWESARAAVLAERGSKSTDDREILLDRLASLDREGLIDMLRRVPPIMLKSLLGKDRGGG